LKKQVLKELHPNLSINDIEVWMDNFIKEFRTKVMVSMVLFYKKPILIQKYKEVWIEELQRENN
jgi:hypothetical protein